MIDRRSIGARSCQRSESAVGARARRSIGALLGIAAALVAGADDIARDDDDSRTANIVVVVVDVVVVVVVVDGA